MPGSVTESMRTTDTVHFANTVQTYNTFKHTPWDRQDGLSEQIAAN